MGVRINEGIPGPGNPHVSPKTILTSAIEAVPAVRFALGVAGIAAAAAIVFSFFKSPVAAIFGTLVLFVLMVLLVVFAALAAIAPDQLKIPALILAWVFVLLFSLSGICAFTAVFFDKPKPFPQLVGLFIPGKTNPITPIQPEGTQIPVNFVIKNETVNLSSLPEAMRAPVPEGLSEEELRKQLSARGSLTIDGGTLIVSAAGNNAGVSLAVNILHLWNGAKIVTNGNNLNLEAVTIDASDGGISSFLEQDRDPQDAPLGTPGRRGFDGGAVKVITLSPVTGVLAIDLLGQDGQRGGQGESGVPGIQGARGQNGVDGLFDCRSGGGDGARGGNGAQGSTGMPGGDGGNGGTLYAKANYLNSGHIQFKSVEGRGASGGTGGSGGPGGQGGEGGSGSVHCGGGHGGPTGSQGPPGGAGNTGRDGKPGNAVPT